MDSSNEKSPYYLAKDVLENVKETEDSLEIRDETESAAKKEKKIFPVYM